MAEAVAFRNIEIVAGGVTEALLATALEKKIKLWTAGGVALAGNVSITDDGTWAEGMQMTFIYTGTVTLGAFNISIFGYTLTQDQASAGNLEITAYNIGGAYVVTAKAGAGTAQIGTADIAPKAVTLAKMANLTAGNMIIGDGSNRPSALDISADAAVPFGQGGGVVAVHAITGDISVIKTGVSAIGSKVIVNGDISDTAGIEVKKLEAMSDGEIVTGNTGLGNIATIVPSSADVIVANSGAMAVQSGVITPEKATTNLKDEAMEVDVSFESGEQGNNTVVVPYNFTILSMYAIVTKAAGGTDTGTITAKINGNPVTTGVITVAISAAVNTEYTVTPSAANTGSAGDELQSVTAKTTAGGHVKVTYKLRKTS